MSSHGKAAVARALGAWLCAVLCLWPGGAGAEEASPAPAAPPAATGGGDGAQGDDPLIGDKPLSELVKQLKSENKGLQLRAAKALVEAPAELRPKMMPKMMELLKSERENDKYVAAQVLGACGSAAKDAVPGLLPMLQGTQYERNRAAAAKALGQILKDAAPGPEIDKVTQALVAVFGDKYDDVRREAVTACGMIGPAAKASISHYKPLLEEPPTATPSMVSTAAAWACERMGPLAKEHVDLLVSLLFRYASDQTPAYVRALGAMGPIQENIVPNIMDFMERGAAWRHLETWQVLQKFGVKAEQVVPFTKRFLTNPQFYGKSDGRHRELAVIEAMKFLQAAGPKAAEALPQVEALINYKYPYNEDDDVTPLMRKEAAKTAEGLKKAVSPEKK